eukprot:scaffold1187_cov374-Prasinococcus_capsulatus_cf.AAC.5
MEWWPRRPHETIARERAASWPVAGHGGRDARREFRPTRCATSARKLATYAGGEPGARHQSAPPSPARPLRHDQSGGWLAVPTRAAPPHTTLECWVCARHAASSSGPLRRRPRGAGSRSSHHED